VRADVFVAPSVAQTKSEPTSALKTICGAGVGVR
jgi:hypothetical protein